MNKKNMKTRAFVFAVVLVFGICGLCMAEDFSFNVPVQLYNIRPEITTGKVRCMVTDRYHAQNTKTGSLHNTIGIADKDFPITNGAYVGSVVIKFNAATGQSPANGTDWSCSLFLYNTTQSNAPGTGWKPADALMSTTYNKAKPYKTNDQGYLK